MKTPIALSPEFYPHQGGVDSAASEGYEADGAPGDKGVDMGSLGAGDSGDSNGTNPEQNALMSAFATMHSRPAVTADPDNVTGSPMPGDPTAAEGA